MKRMFLLGFALFCLSSCISRKQLTYLQAEEENIDDTTYTQALSRKNYQVQINDILNITVKSYNQEITTLFNVTDNSRVGQGGGGGDLLFYLNGYSVSDEGIISLPVVGDLYVLGKTIDEIKVIVKSKLTSYFKDEALFLNVQLAGIRFTIVGDVNSPGKYIIYQNQANIFEALAQAGDITIVGNRQEVQIIRQTPEGVKFYELDLTDRDVISDKRYFIQPNDVINVKPLPAKSLGVGTTAFSTIVSVVTLLSSTLSLIVFIQNID